jgi:hypothetical protein
MMFIRSLADFNRAAGAVLKVTVGAISVTAQAHSYPTQHDEPAKKWGLLDGHQRGLPTGHHCRLSHGHGQCARCVVSGCGDRSARQCRFAVAAAERPSVGGRAGGRGCLLGAGRALTRLGRRSLRLVRSLFSIRHPGCMHALRINQRLQVRRCFYKVPVSMYSTCSGAPSVYA